MLVKMTKDFCAICKGSGYYDAPTERGGYTTRKCDHIWDKSNVKFALKNRRERYERALKEYRYLIQVNKNMEDVR